MSQKLSLIEMSEQGNRFAVIAIDETFAWREDLVAKAKLIEGVYLVDLTQPTHLCELAISFPATHLRNFVPNIDGFEGGSDNEELQDIERQQDDEPTYFKGSNVYEPKKFYNDEEQTEEDIIDYEAGNPCYC